MSVDPSMRGWVCASCQPQRTAEWGEIDSLRAEVERLRAEANARAVEELRAVLKKCGTLSFGWYDLGDYCEERIAELSKPAAKESEKQHGQESTATAAPSRSPQGEGVEVPPRGQDQGASGPRGLGQPAHPPGARGGESGIVAESQGHRPGEAVSDWTVTLAAQAKAAYARSDEPAEELTVHLLAMVVEGICNLGREVRRGGKS